MKLPTSSHIAKRIVHIAINAPHATAFKQLSSLAQPLVISYANCELRLNSCVIILPSRNDETGREHYQTRNKHCFHLESVEASYITHLVNGLLRETPHASIVLLHDGLCVLPVPTEALLVRLDREALAHVRLAADSFPFQHLVHNHVQRAELTERFSLLTPAQLAFQTAPQAPTFFFATSASETSSVAGHWNTSENEKETGA